MATIAQVERRILEIEGFDVTIRHLRDGRDVRGDKANITQYPYQKKLPHSKTVNAWKSGRFASKYPGFTVEVLNWDRSVAHGGTLLGNVRDTYYED